MVLKLFLILVLWIPTAPVWAQSVSELSAQQKQAQQRKANLQKQIQTIQKEILSQESDKQDVIDRLKKSEVAISSLNSKLDQLQEQQDEAKAEIQGLRRDADEQRELLTDLRQDLSEQLYVQYTSGLSPWSALLSGEDAQKIERDLGYLSYVAKARAKAVKTINQEILKLQGLESTIQAEQKKLNQLVNQTEQSKKSLKQEQEKYAVNLKTIEQELKNRRSQAQKMSQDQKRLDQLIDGIGASIQQQKQAIREAEIARQKASQERQKALAEAEQKAQLQAQEARQLAEKAQQLKESARKSQQAALMESRQKEIDLKKAREQLKFAIDPSQEELAKSKIQEALTQRDKARHQVTISRAQSEEAEIEQAKARLAQQKAREASRLERKAREDAEKAKSNASTSSGLQKNAPWPLRGPVKGRFGSTRPDTGDVWRGIMIEANQGAAVKAVASGVVVFADWVRGFGNLIIVDHKNNYLSVYGHNQSLNKSVGDTVSTGQVIAKVGATGGQVEPGLYFEIRQNSKPIDPLRLLAP